MLEVSDICKSFPSVRALRNVSLRFAPGEVHALMGENGAGKSTLMKIITGIHQPDAGQILLNGNPLVFPDYQSSLQAGIHIVHQELQFIPEASVAENIAIDKLTSLSRFGCVQWGRVHELARIALTQVGLEISPEIPMKRLSAAQKQLVQIARALSSDAKVLLLDEPTSCLTPHEANKLYALVRELKTRGKIILLVSHKFEEVFSICDRISVLRDGQCIAKRPTNELTHETLVQLMIGRAQSLQPLGDSQVDRDKEILKVEGLTAPPYCHDASFSLHEGEILGLYGLVGSGRTEFAKVLIGAIGRQRGRVYIDGKEAKISGVHDALHRFGIAYVTENRKEDGLLLNRDLQTNMTLTAWPNLAHPATRRINPHRERALASELVDRLQIRTSGLEVKAKNLSGGNQQKVSLARALANPCRVLIIDEPTVGVDIGAKEQIHQIIFDLAANQRRGVIVISSDMPELLRLSTRILVFRERRIVGEIDDVNLPENTYEQTSAAIGNLLLN